MQIERKKKPHFIQPIVLAGMECEQESIQLPTQEFINKLIESHSPQEFFVPMRFGAQYHARDADGFFIPNPKQIPCQKQQQNQSFQGAEQKLQLQDMQRLEQIGQGVSGVVQRAIHVPTNRLVALKNIQIVNDETFTKQVMLELQTLVSCNHENILSCYGAFIEGSQITIAMEYMNVGTLQDVLKRQGRIPEVMLGQIAYQLLLGLDYLHRTKKIIHRDIKPSNILLNSEGLIKISDFGVSGQLLNTKDQRDTWIGTVSYMSPERFRGESYSADTDVWSLGICLLECAYGHFPYLDKNTTFWEMMEAINSKPTPQCPPDDYSLEMNDFIQKCLRKEKGTRPTALELLNLPIIKQYEGVSLTYLKNWLNIS